MPPVKKKDLFNPMESIQGILKKDEWMFQEDSDNGGNKIYSEIPVDITTFVSSKDWLGIAPQKDPDTGEQAESPLSAPQLDFLMKATDFENGITDFVLWV